MASAIRNRRNGHYCLYNELRNTTNKTISSLARIASQEPKKVNDNSWWKSPLIGSAGAILAATLAAFLAWCLNKRGRCCWNTRPEEDENLSEDSDACESNSSADEDAHDSSVTHGDSFHAQVHTNGQVSGHLTICNIHSHTHYNSNGKRKTTTVTGDRSESF